VVGPVVDFFAGWLTFGSDPTQYHSCTCNPDEYPCESVGPCLVLNSGCVRHPPETGTRPDTSHRPSDRFGRCRDRYMFTEVLAPALLAGLLLWYTLADVLALMGKVAEAIGVYLGAAASAFKDTVETYVNRLRS